MVGEGTMDRWIALEMTRLQGALVTQTRPLADLLAEPEPQATTKGGFPYRFDRAVLQRFHDALGALDRRRLRLPVTFYVDRDLPDDAYLQDETAIRLLAGLGEVTDVTPREGRLWLGHARARAIAERHPAAFQFVQL